MTRLGPVSCPILVGRDELLDLADLRLADVVDGHGQFLLLSGEAGVGKSRLIGAITRKAEARGFRVAEGYVAPQDHQVPASSILDMARNMLRIPAWETLGRDLLQLRDDASTTENVRRRMLVVDVVDRLTAALDRPTLLVFEDLQWADELSLEIVGELARQGRDRPIFLVGAYRTDELGPNASLRNWRSRLLTQRLAEEARLTPLTLEQTALVTTLILGTGLPAPREVVTAVYERTDGVPLHIEELLGVIGDEARSNSRAIRDADVPDTIEDAVLERIGRRSPQAQAVARAGAVIGRCFVPHVLAGIMDLPLEALDAPLQELVDHDVLDAPGLRGLYDFRHQLLRDALYRTVPTADRRRYHARAGEFGAQLEGASEIHASVHFERAGLRAQAFRAALSGARTAARLSSHREAFELYRRALDNAADDMPDEERAQLLEAFSEEAAAIEENLLSESLAREARQRYLAAGNLVAAARSVAVIGSLMRRDSRSGESRIDVVREALAELEPLPVEPERDTARAWLLVVLTLAQIDALHLDDARQSALAARDAAEAAGDAATVIQSQELIGMIDVIAGSPDLGLPAITNAAIAAREAGFEEVSITAYRNAAVMAARVMDYRAAQRWLSEGLRYADAIEQSHCAHVMSATSSLVAWARGSWDDALNVGQQALADHGCRRAATMARWPLGYVALGRGELDRARSLFAEAAAVGRESGAPDLILPASWGLAETAILAADPAAAVDECEAALALALAAGERALIAPLVVTGVRANQAAGRPDEAERWLARASDHLAGTSSASWPAVDHGRGLVALAAGSLGIARGALEAAVRGWDERDRIWEASWARLDLASCLLRSNRFAEAMALVADVAATASRLESPPLAARADELRRLARGRGMTEEPWRPLTAREFEVARLIRDGLTNIEIGRALTIAPKTASAHVEHILAKLGVNRRAEIAAWVASVTRSPSASQPPRTAVGASR